MNNLDVIRRWGNLISLIGVAQFLCLSTIAMGYYPGGSPMNHHSEGYRYFQNPYSDLGRTIAWNGEKNTTASYLFNTSMIVLGCSMLPFFCFVPMHAPDKALLLLAAAILGIFSSLCLVGIGLTPYDLYFKSHHWWLAGWVLLLISAASIHFFALLLSKECSDFFAIVSLGLVIFIALYMSFGMDQAMEYLRRQMTEETTTTLFMMQKFLVLYCVGWYAVCSLRMVMIPKVTFVSTTERVNADAADYMKRYGRKS